MKTLIAILASISLVGCAHFPGLADREKVCGETAAQDGFEALMGRAQIALTGGGNNWDADLSMLVAAAGPAAVCAISAVVASYEAGAVQYANQVQPAVLMPISRQAPPWMVCARGHSFLQAHGFSQ